MDVWDNTFRVFSLYIYVFVLCMFRARIQRKFWESFEKVLANDPSLCSAAQLTFISFLLEFECVPSCVERDCMQKRVYLVKYCRLNDRVAIWQLGFYFLCARLCIIMCSVKTGHFYEDYWLGNRALRSVICFGTNGWAWKLCFHVLWAHGYFFGEGLWGSW